MKRPTTLRSGMHSFRRRGTSLIELLVVIVVLLIGILGVVQTFPQGFGILQTTRAYTIMTELARSQSDALKGRAEQLPEMILPTSYSFLGSSIVNITVDASRRPGDLYPVADGINANGSLIVGGDSMGYWPYVTGANLLRRIVSEGGPVPSPRSVGGFFGGLMVLQFAPIVYNDDPAYRILLQVYGNDMVRRWGDPGFASARDWQYYVEDAGQSFGQIHLPTHPSKTREYRLQMTAWVSVSGNSQPREIVDAIITVPPGPQGYTSFLLSSFVVLGAGESYIGAEFGSIRVARLFDRLPVGDAFTLDPYEYKLLDANLGVLLFNPVGYDYEVRFGNRREPLKARVNYDVFDWRVIRDEFRIPNTTPYQVKLKLGGLKTAGDYQADDTRYPGLNVPVPSINGSPQNVDVVLLDVETGGVFLFDPAKPRDPSPPAGTVNDYLALDPALCSYAVDMSRGFVSLIDYDRSTPGLQLRLMLPGAVSPVTVNAEGRLVRALYQATGEWAVQVQKAPATFRQTYGGPNVAEYYVGGSNSTLGGQVTRIYFPVMDTGKNVTIGEVWYRDSGGTLRALHDENFRIQDTPADPIGPYVDITSVDPSAVGFDWTNGYAVRNVQGASVEVRVLWNPSAFNLRGNSAQVYEKFILWTRTWRQAKVETFLQRGVEQ
ncbi:MAG: hypothetical protein KJZ62_06130 [Fimbriimonadaceae bacterium]|nr:hypothetical protein [Fimbriimonadaceae bacterium]MCL4284662.1 hypothetical protein [Fimbriimonadaceae bacterium]QOJ11673.1 MAG: hypothetical protein HRU74_06240 [Chthonomonadaceae bacterium]